MPHRRTPGWKPSGWALVLLSMGVNQLAACAGPAWLQPADSLPPGQSEVTAGLTHRFAGHGESLRRLHSTPGHLRRPHGEHTTAPWLALRHGFTHHLEGRAFYGGSGGGIGLRAVTREQRWALSGGAELAYLHVPDPAAELETARGLSVGVPVVGGWHSRAELVSVWFGGRARYEALWAEATAEALDDVQLQHLAAGPLFGLAVGMTPIWVRLELAMEFDLFWLEHDAARRRAHGISWLPAAAVAVRF